VEISSAPGLATRGASLFAPANGKSLTRAIPISRVCPMFSAIATGQIKFSQFPRDDRAGARKRGDALPRRSPTRGRFAVNELARLRRGRVSSRSRSRRNDLSLRLIKFLKAEHYFPAGGEERIQFPVRALSCLSKARHIRISPAISENRDGNSARKRGEPESRERL